MPNPSPETKKRTYIDADNAREFISAAIVSMPDGLDADRANAFVDMACGMSITDAAAMNGLTFDQCRHIRRRFAADLERLQPMRDKFLENICETVVYTLCRKGLEAATHLNASDLKPTHISALANAAQVFRRIAAEVPKPPSTQHLAAAQRDTRAALADLAAIQDVVVSPAPGTSGKPNTT